MTWGQKRLFLSDVARWFYPCFPGVDSLRSYLECGLELGSHPHAQLQYGPACGPPAANTPVLQCGPRLERTEEFSHNAQGKASSVVQPMDPSHHLRGRAEWEGCSCWKLWGNAACNWCFCIRVAQNPGNQDSWAPSPSMDHPEPKPGPQGSLNLALFGPQILT